MRFNFLLQATTIGLLLAVALLAGCDTETPVQRGTKNFRVNPDLLGVGFRTDTGLRVWSPSYWPGLAMTDISDFAARLETEPFLHPPTTMVVFKSDSTDATLSLSWFNGLPPNRYEDLVDARHSIMIDSGASVDLARFTHNGCNFDHLAIATADQVRINVFVSKPDAPLFLLDFVVPSSGFAMELPAIETVLGTLEIDPGNQEVMDASRYRQ